MALIFCRHGQTEFNLEDRFQGVADSPLTESGKEQARKLNEFLKQNFNVKKFYISPLPRIKQTYDITSTGIVGEVEIVQELREVCYGDWDGVIRSEIDKNILEKREKDRFNFVYPGSFNGIQGESYQIVFERVKPFFQKLIELEKQNGEDICILAHNGILLAAVKFFEDLPDEEEDRIRIANNEILIVKVNEYSETSVTKLEL